MTTKNTRMKTRTMLAIPKQRSNGRNKESSRRKGREKRVANSEEKSQLLCVPTALEWKGAKGMKAEGEKEPGGGDRWPFQTMRNSGDKGGTER